MAYWTIYLFKLIFYASRPLQLKKINLLVTLLGLLSSLLLFINDIELDTEIFLFCAWAYLRCISRRISQSALIWSNLINTCYCYARIHINNFHKVKFNWILAAAKIHRSFCARLFFIISADVLTIMGPFFSRWITAYSRRRKITSVI